MPVFCGKVISLEMSCGRELEIRRSGGKGQLESVELEISRSVALAARATTVVTAHTVWGREKRKNGKFGSASEEWKVEVLSTIYLTYVLVIMTSKPDAIVFMIVFKPLS